MISRTTRGSESARADNALLRLPERQPLAFALSSMSEECTTTTIAVEPPRREVLTAPVPPLQIGPYSFWPPIFPAPMCGISDRPWRQFAREQGCPLVYTQMVSCEAMARNGRDKSWQILDMFVEPGIICAQVFGADPVNLADCARRL
ncbi:MAG: tRNA-dihydrouridine synthase, partial [Candidatus Sumerlaeota bacterium]